MNFHRLSSRRGVTLTEVLVVLAILGFFVLLGALVLPRQREVARSVQCEKNLMQLGLAMGLYADATGQVPTMPLLPADPSDTSASAIGALLATLAVPDFYELQAQKKPNVKGITEVHPAARLRGLICPSDPRGFDLPHPAPISYRAVTGDTADGKGGVFELGKVVTIAQVEAADGLSFTACFTERLIGLGPDLKADPANYHVVSGPLADGPCPESKTEVIRGDAGANWSIASWSNSLINHALIPGAPISCIGSDGKTALVSASSGHGDFLHHLMLDGGVRRTKTSIALGPWKALATMDDGGGPSK